MFGLVRCVVEFHEDLTRAAGLSVFKGTPETIDVEVTLDEQGNVTGKPKQLRLMWLRRPG